MLLNSNRYNVSSSEGYVNRESGAPPPDEWKRRDHKHAPYLEPVSPPENNHHNNRYDRLSEIIFNYLRRT